LSGVYRPIDDVAGDVARLAGFVYVSQIAYAGLLYPPALTPPAYRETRAAEADRETVIRNFISGRSLHSTPQRAGRGTGRRT
jgi:hypothetical protein